MPPHCLRHDMSPDTSLRRCHTAPILRHYGHCHMPLRDTLRHTIRSLMPRCYALPRWHYYATVYWCHYWLIRRLPLHIDASHCRLVCLRRRRHADSHAIVDGSLLLIHKMTPPLRWCCHYASWWYYCRHYATILRRWYASWLAIIDFHWLATLLLIISLLAIHNDQPPHTFRPGHNRAFSSAF